MMSADFTPYWKSIGGPPEGPNSWAFFIVAKIAGHHRPVAVVSSTGDNAEVVESLQGYPLTACCRRIVTIFSDPENHTAIRAELALAADFYCSGGRQHTTAPVELPPLRRYGPFQPERWRSWDHDRLHEFPFIAACLLQGVAFDAVSGRTCQTLLEPLETVYRDSSLEWGIVVIDITDLHTVRYGIVGFPVHRAKFVASAQDENQFRAVGERYYPQGELRLVDEEHHRKAMTAAEYMVKFNLGHGSHEQGNAVEDLSRVALVGTDALSLVWPRDAEETETSSLILETTTDHDELSSGLPAEPMETASITNEFEKTILKDIQGTPVTKQGLQKYLVQQRDRLFDARAEGQLIRLAFSQGSHLSLEKLSGIPSQCVARVLGGPASDQFTSTSICIDTVHSTAAELIDILSRESPPRKIIFVQSPDRKDDDMSVRVFGELAARPHLLAEIDVTLTGAYSAALRKRSWLPATKIDDNVQLAPLGVYPVQQILVRHQLDYPHNPGISLSYQYGSVYLGDALLKPERFASGFLLYLATLWPGGDEIFDSKAQLFSFSSCPDTLAATPRTSAPISPILTENWALPMFFPHSDALASPQVRDLVPEGWTVIVLQQEHWHPDSSYTYSFQYAFIRPRQQRIVVDVASSQPHIFDDIEVVGLGDFLNTTAPKIDSSTVHLRLQEIADRLAGTGASAETSPPRLGPLSLLTHGEAAKALSELLNWAKETNHRLRMAFGESL